MKIIYTVLFVSIIAFFAGCGAEKPVVAKFQSFAGEVMVKAVGKTEFVKAASDQSLFTGDAIRTGKESFATVMNLENKAKIQIFPESYFEIKGQNSMGMQNNGQAIFEVDKQEKEIVVETPHGVTAVLGTKFGQVVTQDGFELLVEKGVVEFTATNGSKKKVTAAQKIMWKTSEELPEPAEVNLIESESFFGESSFRFNQR